MVKELWELSASEIVRKIETKEITAKDVAVSCAERIKDLDPEINAWTYFDRNRFVENAEAVDKKLLANNNIGKLEGVPVGVKDIFNTADMPTCMGSKIWKGFTPGNDARAVFRVKQEGGVVAGKTVTAEFAVHDPGPTRNPHNIDHYPGTSSSGSAAAVSCGMVPVSLGTQTAGSIIRPASYCGIYGYKPTFGLIPRTGILKTTDTLDQVGWFARNIEDIEMLLDVIRVKGPNYPFVQKYLDERDNKDLGKSQRKVAFLEHPKWNYTEDYTKDAFSKFFNELSSEKNIAASKITLPDSFNEAHKVHDIIYNKTLSYYFAGEYEKKHLVSKVLCGLIQEGLEITLAEYKDAMAKQVSLRGELENFFEEYDVIVTPSTSGEAPLFKKPVDKPDSCLIWSLCGAPALNVPMFSGPQGLPFGLQVVAKRYDDLLLMNFAKKLKEKGFINDVSCVGMSCVG